MRNVLLVCALVLAAVTVETGLARWIPGPGVIPVVLPVALAAAFLTTHRRLLRFTLLAGVAAELGSGLPAGVALVTTVVTPHALLALLRRPRPDLPTVVRGGVAGLATLAVLLLYRLSATQFGKVPSELLLPTAIQTVVAPSIFAGCVAIVAHRVLTRTPLSYWLARPGVSS